MSGVNRGNSCRACPLLAFERAGDLRYGLPSKRVAAGRRMSRMITQKAKYALRALTLLARAEPGEPIQIPEIAEQQKIPKKFLEQIMLDLKRGGMVESRRGKQGGYLLLRPASDITYGEVLRLIDGPVAPLPCLSLTAYRPCEDCDGETDCEIRRVFARVADETRAVLLTTSLADAAANAGDTPH